MGIYRSYDMMWPLDQVTATEKARFSLCLCTFSVIYGVFRYCLFCWNWKIITKSTVDKGKS